MAWETFIGELAPEQKNGCPHKDIRDCPLYLAAHVAGAGGCDDGRLGDGGCAVSRGLDYGHAVARLWASRPDLIEEQELDTMRRRSAEQRKRNMTRNGIH